MSIKQNKTKGNELVCKGRDINGDDDGDDDDDVPRRRDCL